MEFLLDNQLKFNIPEENLPVFQLTFGIERPLKPTMENWKVRFFRRWWLSTPKEENVCYKNDFSQTFLLTIGILQWNEAGKPDILFNHLWNGSYI